MATKIAQKDMPGSNNKENYYEVEFEEAFKVIQKDDTHWEGVRPLRLPISGARGVYGGHMCAQALLVALESTPGYVMESFHSYFIGPGNSKVICRFEVLTLVESTNFVRKQIKVIQSKNGKDRTPFICMCSMVKPGVRKSKVNFQRDIPTDLQIKHPNPDDLTVIRHTDWVKNAYSEELKDYKKCPHENDLSPSERWVSLYSGLNQANSFKDPKFNYVGLGCISDSAILTTLARVLHLPWNPTEMFNEEEFDEQKDAKNLMALSLNILHLYHYNAMSLDHHIYFHTDDYNSFDVVKQWLTLTYQMKILSNGRTLVRGHFYKPDGECVATIVQEGLTLLHKKVAEKL